MTVLLGTHWETLQRMLEADLPLAELAAAPFPKLVVSRRTDQRGAARDLAGRPIVTTESARYLTRRQRFDLTAASARRTA